MVAFWWNLRLCNRIQFLLWVPFSAFHYWCGNKKDLSYENTFGEPSPIRSYSKKRLNRELLCVNMCVWIICLDNKFVCPSVSNPTDDCLTFDSDVFACVWIITISHWGLKINFWVIMMVSVLWCCWLGGRKGIRPVTTEWWGTGMERGADLHMAQLMPLPLTVSCSSNIQIGFTFLVPAYPGSPGKEAVKWL